MPRTQIQRFKPIDDLPNNVPFLWRQVIRKLSFPETNKESEAEVIIRLERTSILEEIIRIRWDSTFRSDLKPPKNIRTGITLSANLWNRVIDLLLEIYFLNPRPPHPAIHFAHLIRERQIDCLHISGKNKSEAIKIIQSQNQDLKALKNPFPLEYHYSRSLFKSALRIAERMDRFRIGKLTPVREAREKLTQHLRSEATFFEKEGEERFAPVSGKRKNFREQPQTPTP
jgi:hypothetical protein